MGDQLDLYSYPEPGLSGDDRSGATSDQDFVQLWLATRASPHTRRAYARVAAMFLAFLVGRPLRSVRVSDLQSWVDQLDGAPATRAQRVAAVRSLLAYGHRTGYLSFDVGAAIKQPKVPDELAERILTEEEVFRVISAARGWEEALLRFLYVSGARISEAATLTWRQLHRNADGGATVTIHGKGGKTRHVRITPLVLNTMLEILVRADRDWLPQQIEIPSTATPVFASRTGRPRRESWLFRTIQRVARRAGFTRPVSPHWFRHAHATHALSRGAPIHLVQATLGHSSVATTGRYLHASPEKSSGDYLGM